MTSNSPDRIMENPSECIGSSIRRIAARSHHSLSSRRGASDSSLSTRGEEAVPVGCMDVRYGRVDDGGFGGTPD